ncbi:MAG: hypothetical protein ACI9MR_004786, partial [Myxococcota bacterium]
VFAIVCVVFGASLGACGAAQHPQSVTQAEPTPSVIELELAQAAEIARFDAATAGSDACEGLCHHLEQICILGGRICQMIGHTRDTLTPNACDRASMRCEATRERLPPSCVCAG